LAGNAPYRGIELPGKKSTSWDEFFKVAPNGCHFTIGSWQLT
jgi:hypothetical protein